MKTRAFIGTSGFSYQHWKGVFYPDDLPQNRWLEFYASKFDTVELNNTFYSMPKPNICKNWAQKTPEDFLFVVKLNRVITHRFRLLHSKEYLERFLEAIQPMQEKLGPILVQLPPKMKADAARLDEFLSFAPKNQKWCLEFRDSDWLKDEIYDLLKKHNAALVIHDLIPNHPVEITADFVYMRFHGTGAKYAGNYSNQELAKSARLINNFRAESKDVYVYFNNDAHGYAVQNAMTLNDLMSRRKRKALDNETRSQYPVASKKM